jgi:hypothetical protein
MKSTVTMKDSKVKGSESGIKKKKLRNLGSINVDESQLPEIRDWNVGDEYEFTVKVRQTQIREVDNWEIEEYGLPKGYMMGTFEIISVSNKSTETTEEKTNKYKK